MRYPHETIKGPLFPSGTGGGLIPGGIGAAGVAIGLSEYGKRAGEDLLKFLENWWNTMPPPPAEFTPTKIAGDWYLKTSCPYGILNLGCVGHATFHTWAGHCPIRSTGDYCASIPDNIKTIAYGQRVPWYWPSIGFHSVWWRDVTGPTDGAPDEKVRMLPFENIDPFTETDNVAEAYPGIETKAPPLPLRKPAQPHPIPVRKASAYGTIQWATAQGSQRGNTVPVPISIFDAFPDVAGTTRNPPRRAAAAQAPAVPLPQTRPIVQPLPVARAVPKRGEREAKVHVTMFGNTIPATVFGALTEVLDLVDCLYEGLPGKLSPNRDDPIFGSTDYKYNTRNPVQSVRRVPLRGFNLNSAQKAQAIFDDWRLLDVPRTIEACLKNQLIDSAGGVAGALSRTVSRGLGIPVGVTTIHSVLNT